LCFQSYGTNGTGKLGAGVQASLHVQQVLHIGRAGRQQMILCEHGQGIVQARSARHDVGGRGGISRAKQQSGQGEGDEFFHRVTVGGEAE